MGIDHCTVALAVMLGKVALDGHVLAYADYSRWRWVRLTDVKSGGRKRDVIKKE